MDQTQTATNQIPVSPPMKLLKSLMWFGLFLSALVFFTFVKLPDEPIRALFTGYVNQALGPMNLRLDAQSSYFSLWMGPRYVLKEVTLTKLDASAQEQKVGKISLIPKIIPLLLLRQAARIQIEHSPGVLLLDFSKGSKHLSVGASARELNLGTTPYLDLFSGIKVLGVLNGSGNMSGNPEENTTMEGELDFDISKLSLPTQTVQGIRIPPLTLTSAKISGEIKKGVLTFSDIAIGKAGKGDDIVVTGSGTIQGGKSLFGTRIALKLKLQVSQKVLDSFPLLDGLLGATKKGEGLYSFELTGPLTSPSFSPTP